MDSNTLQNLQEAYSQVHQLDEISQKTATSAYASSKTGEFEGADSERDVKRTDNLKKHIVRKFGKEAGEHADKAAEAQTFGRKDASGKSKGLPKSRIEKSDYRTTQDGKMHKQDQKELKTELRIKRDRRLRKEDVETDLFDYLLEYLVSEGYADTNKAAIAIMANMSEEWRQSIVEAGMNPSETSAAKQQTTKAAVDFFTKPRKPLPPYEAKKPRFGALTVPDFDLGTKKPESKSPVTVRPKEKAPTPTAPPKAKPPVTTAPPKAKTPTPTAPSKVETPKTEAPKPTETPKVEVPKPKGGEVAMSKIGDKSDYSVAATAKMSDRTKTILGTKDSETGKTIRKPQFGSLSPRERQGLG